MNNQILNKYKISLNKLSNGIIKVKTSSKNLDAYLFMLTRQKSLIEDFIETINLTLLGNAISNEDKEWSIELGLQIYTGIIKEDLTFDLFLEDYYEQTLETFPLTDIKEILKSLLEFI